MPPPPELGQQAPLGLCMVEAAGERLLFANPPMCALWGLPVEACRAGAGPPLALLREALAAQLPPDAPLPGGLGGPHARPRDEELRLHDGRRVRWRCDRVEAGSVQPPGWLHVFEDVTHRPWTDEQQSLADRSAALGTVAAGIAHELNNPLTYVMGNVTFAQRLIDAEAGLASERRQELRGLLGESLEGLERIRCIVRELRSFSRVESQVAAAPQRAAAAPPPAPAPIRARILLIDDEPRLAQSMRRLLSVRYDVQVELEGSRGLQRLLEEPFDLVLCDLMMPGMSGMQLHEALVRARPAVAQRLVFLTGGAYTEAARAFLARTSNPVLEKPVPPRELERFVAAQLQQRPA